MFGLTEVHLGLLEVLDRAEISVAGQELDGAVSAMDCGVDEVDGVLVCFDCVLEPLRWLWLWFGAL